MEITTYPPSDFNPKWTITGDGTGFAGCQDNHEVEDLVNLTAPVVARWDSEAGQLFAYTDTQNEAKLLVAHIKKTLGA